MAINQEARIPVYLNDEQAKQALKNLRNEAEKWRKKMHEAMAAGDPKGVKQAEREMKKATAAANKLKRETFDVDKVLQNLSRASVADLRKALNRLRSEQRLLNRDTKEYKAISKQIGAIKGEFSKVNGAITRQRGLMGRLTGSVKGLLPAFGFFAIIQGLRRVASITIEFQKAQSNLAAVLGKTRQEIQDLADDAIRYGSVTAFTASQVTELQTAFARMGFSQNQIKASTRATLDLAAATNAELGPAAETVAVALNAFGLSAEHAGEVAATLAVGTSRSALAFADYQTILSTVGPVSRAFGFSLEETVALTGKLRDAGFDASSAATATRNIFLNLADSSGKLAQALGRPIRSLDDLAPALAELRARGIDLNETLQLTDKRSVAAFNTFLGATDTMLDLRDSVTGVTDELQEMVEVQLDNVAGDITILKSAWQGFILSIEQGDGVLARFTRGTLKFFTDSLIKLANIDLIFKRAGKFTTDEVADVYDAMLNLSGRKYKKFQELVKQENKLALDQVILRKDAMIQDIRATGQSLREAEMLWEEFFRRYAEMHYNAQQVARQGAPTPAPTPAAPPTPGEAQGLPEMVEMENIKLKEVNEREQQIDLLKSMEKDWVEYQKQMSREGKGIAEQNIKHWESQQEGYEVLARERVWAAGQIMEALMDMAGRESKLGKALFLLNQARAVGEVIFNTGVANAKAVAASPMTAGQPWVAVNTATAVGSIAAILGQTISQFTGKKQGGYTGPGTDDTIADFVHANEFVVNAKATRNPSIRKFLDIINQAQIAGTVAQLDFSKMIPPGRQNGGYIGTDYKSAPAIVNSTAGADLQSVPPITEKLDQMITEIKNIKIYAAIETIEKERKNYMTITQTSGL